MVIWRRNVLNMYILIYYHSMKFAVISLDYASPTEMDIPTARRGIYTMLAPRLCPKDARTVQRCANAEISFPLSILIILTNLQL